MDETSYELWNAKSGNIIGSFATIDETLAIVRQLLDSYGQSYASELFLGRRNGDDPATIVGDGHELVAMLEHSAAGAEGDAVRVARAG